MFSITSRVSSPDESFLSFDCFISEYEIKSFAPNNELFKTFLLIWFPVLLIGFIGVLLGTIKIIHALLLYTQSQFRSAGNAGGPLFNFKRSMVVSVICIIFLFHPTFTLKSLSVFL